MDHANPSHSNPTPPRPSTAPSSISALESTLPTADANQLLDLIAKGHNPNDLHQLINNSIPNSNKAA